MLFIRTKHNMQSFGVIPFIQLLCNMRIFGVIPFIQLLCVWILFQNASSHSCFRFLLKRTLSLLRQYKIIIRFYKTRSSMLYVISKGHVLHSCFRFLLKRTLSLLRQYETIIRELLILQQTFPTERQIN